MKTSTFIPILCSLGLMIPSGTFADNSPDQGIMLTPGDMQWKDNPRVAGLGVANIIGHGKQEGAYVYRVKFPKGRVVHAHSHPDDRTYTVISGTWHIGWGDKYDPGKLTALPPGSFYTEPAGMSHFVSTPDEDTVVQITGMGPTSAQFVDPAHAPKK